MKADIGVGVPGEAHAVRDFDAAYRDMITRGEGVDIETLTDPDVAEPRRNQPLGGGEIIGRRNLQIVVAAGDRERRQPRRLRYRRVVGQPAPDSGAVSGKNRIELKALRRLRPPQR